MQKNPNRIRSSIGTHNIRVYRRNLGGIWINVPCYCCLYNKAKRKKYQKRLSKQKTLRSHRETYLEVV